MLKRIIVGTILISIITLTIYLRTFSVYFADILILLFLLPGTYEAFSFFKKAGYKPLLIPVLFAAILVYPLQVLFLIYVPNKNSEIAILITLALSVLICLINFTFKHKYKLNDMLATMFILLYPITLFSLFITINHEMGELKGILLVLLISVLSDTFAYFVGVTLGKRKLCPSISPKKTIAGAIGGIIGSLIACTILFLIFEFSEIAKNIPNAGKIYLVENDMYLSLTIYMIFGVIVGIMSQLGDLAASWIKRNAGLKDFGHIFPGHGGILDRIDSFIFVMPAVFLLFKILASVNG